MPPLPGDREEHDRVRDGARDARDGHDGRSGARGGGDVDDDDPAWCATVPAGLDDHWPTQGDGHGDGGASASADPGRSLAHDGAGHGGHSGLAPAGEAGACGLPDVPTPAELGGLLDGLVSDFRQGASVLAWHLAEPAKGSAAGGEGCHLPSAEVGPATGLVIGLDGDAALPASLDLCELLGGGGHALLDGLDLEAALQRALDSAGSAPSVHGPPDAQHFSVGDATACAPAASQVGSADPAQAAAGSGPSGEVQHALVSVELAWSGCGSASSPLAPLLDPQRHGGEGC